MLHRHRHVFIAMGLISFGCTATVEPPMGSSSSSGGPGGGGSGGMTVTGGMGGVGGDGIAGFQPGVGGSGGNGGNQGCLDVPPVAAGPDAIIAMEYAGIYKAYDLGPIPGAPPQHLGGCTIDSKNPNRLLFAGDSENTAGAIYAIDLDRGPCGHIVGFKGTAVKIADTPYVDANLVYGPNDVLFYTQWPVNKLSQILPGQAMPAVTIDGATIGINTGDSVSGFGFAPPWVSAAGQPRTVTWAGGHWFHLNMTTNGSVFDLSGAAEQTVLPGGPGGFAYIPQGSPGFPNPSLIMAEWSDNKVSTYQINDMGDPMVASRKEFFTTFPRPWGAYFESQTGDFLFLTWGTVPDRVFVVQGFAVPPPPPPPPK